MFKLLAAAALLCAPLASRAVTITFDDAVGAYTPTPGVTQDVSNQFASLGVIFRDVADPSFGVTLGKCGPGNGAVSLFGHGSDFGGCGDTTPNFDILFVDPTDGTTAATTGFFSLLTTDGLIRATAFDSLGDLLGSTQVSAGSMTLSFAGMARIRIFSVDDDATTLDDLSFDTPAAAGVPEPAGWALMMGGFGVIGAAARRRRELLA